jgi:hypothetical protein
MKLLNDSVCCNKSKTAMHRHLHGLHKCSTAHTGVPNFALVSLHVRHGAAVSWPLVASTSCRTTIGTANQKLCCSSNDRCNITHLMPVGLPDAHACI